jgi:ribonuclease R
MTSIPDTGPGCTRRLADPFLARESQKYANPLPSREYVQAILHEAGVPLNFEALTERLGIAEEETPFFERRLRAMVRDGQLIRNRSKAWLLPDKADLISGKVLGHPDGYGFLIRDDGQQDVFLGPKEMRSILHGDRVLVHVGGQDKRGRPEGRIVEVLERVNRRVVGRVLHEHGLWIVVPENRRLIQDILVSPKGLAPIAGQVVVIELIEQPTPFSQPIGQIVEILGHYADPGMEIEIALRKHEMPFEFSAAVLAQAAQLPAKVRKKDKADRTDLTALPFVTIDGETAKDFDDAVYAKKEGRGYRLWVAIADVAHYVRPDTELDRAAFERGNSVYFPRRVIPMLPEALSNELCSLKPSVERLVMVAEMVVSAFGNLKDFSFYPAVILSQARLTYTQVADALYEKNAEVTKALQPWLCELETLDKVFRALLKARSKRGAIDFETTETRILFDENGKIDRIVPEVRNDAHRLIEECMLAANVCASRFLAEHGQATLYRIHESPSEEKITRLRDFLAEFGLSLEGKEAPEGRDFAKVLEAIGDKPERALLQTVMLRSLRQARYSPDNVGHFGLAYEAYTHFTSPIRRYPDLLVHRAIKAVLDKKPFSPGDWEAAGLHCSATERRADEASRDVLNWLKCHYMQDKIGECFDASVVSVVHFGLFVALDTLFVEGLVHISELGNDYFHFDEVRHALLGERTGRQFRLADRVRVQLVRVDMQNNKIEFRLIEGNTGRTSATLLVPPKREPVLSTFAGKEENTSPSKSGKKVKNKSKKQHHQKAEGASNKKTTHAKKGDGARKARKKAR